jgi:hypothetical protein
MNDDTDLQRAPLVIDFDLWYRRLRMAAFNLAREKGYPAPHLLTSRPHYQQIYHEQRSRLVAAKAALDATHLAADGGDTRSAPGRSFMAALADAFFAAFCCQATGSITEDNEMRSLLREYGVSDNEALTATLAVYDLADDPRPPEERIALAVESWRASCQAFFERCGGTRIR